MCRRGFSGIRSPWHSAETRVCADAETPVNEESLAASADELQSTAARLSPPPKGNRASP